MMGDCYCAAVVEALSRKVGVVVVVVVVVVVAQGGLFFDHCGVPKRFWPTMEMMRKRTELISVALPHQLFPP